MGESLGSDGVAGQGGPALAGRQFGRAPVWPLLQVGTVAGCGGAAGCHRADKYETRCSHQPALAERLFWVVTQVGDMAALLRARSRWVVTGTPIGNGGLRDLHGLLRVLQHDPFQDRRLWRVCVEQPCLRGESPSRCGVPKPEPDQALSLQLVQSPRASMLSSKPRR